MKGISTTKTVVNHFLVGGAMLVVVFGSTMVASAQTRTIRIVTYNIEDDINGATVPLPGLIAPSGGSVTNGGVLEGIGEEVLASGTNQPLDILALQETTSNGTTVQPIVNGLNAFYLSRNISAGYAMSTYQATESGGDTADGNGPNAVVYNTNTVQLLASVPVDPAGGTSKLGSASGEYREVMRYEFAPAGVVATTNNEFYIYVSHYKSGTTSADLTARTGESGIIRTNSATLPSNARVVYVGDYNVTTSSEVSYQNIVGTALIGIRGIDPFNTNGTTGINWNSSALKSEITESATDLRYRDDFHVVSSNAFVGVPGGLALISGTYHSFGNNGSSPFQGSVNSGNTSLNSDLNTNGVGITASQLYSYLTTASDHLPVVADYTIPIGLPAPVASFTGSPTNGAPPLAVTFTDTSSGSVTNWFWNFGDGGTTNLATNSVLYTYNTAGVYTVTEIVSGTGGSSTNTKANYITVATPPPIASFTGSPTSGTDPLLVTFTDASSGSITNWFWDFGNGSTTNFTVSTNPSQTYTAGTYSVSLTVSGPGGNNTLIRTSYITVLSAFQAWQIQYFGSTNNPSAAPGADPDGDGQNNLAEFLAGTNPTNSDSGLQITSVVAQGSDVLITWATAGGETNVVQATTGLPDGSYSTNFVDLSPLIIISGSGDATTNYLDSGGATNVPSRYYRIRLQP